MMLRAGISVWRWIFIRLGMVIEVSKQIQLQELFHSINLKRIDLKI